MARDQYEYDVGGQLRDRYGRRQLLITGKHAPPGANDAPRGYEPSDPDGREEIVIPNLVDPNGNFIPPVTIASTSQLPASVASGSSPGIVAGRGWDFNGSVAVVDDRPIDIYNTQTNPASVTDWGVVINGLMADGRKMHWGPHEGDFTTRIAFGGHQGVTVEGASGRSWRNDFPASNAVSRLVYKGAATSAALVDMSASDSCTLRDIGIYYDNSGGAVTGYLVDNGNVCCRALIEKCSIGSLGGAVKTALAAINYDQAVVNTVRDSMLSDAKWAVLGLQGGGFSNVVLLDNVDFNNCSAGFIGNIGSDWTIVNPTYEIHTTPVIIGADMTLVPGGTLHSNFVHIGGWAGDQDAVGGPIVVQPQNNWWDSAVFQGGIFGPLGGPIFQLLGAGAIVIKGNDMRVLSVVSSMVDLGNLAVATQWNSGTTYSTGQIVGYSSDGNSYISLQNSNLNHNPSLSPTFWAVYARPKQSVSIEDNGWDNTGGSEAVINKSGHFDVSVKRNGSRDGLSPERETIRGHRNVGYPFTYSSATAPAIAASSGITLSGTPQCFGTDSDGWIRINFTGVAVAADVRIVDVTFNRVYDQAPTNFSDARAQVVIVHLEPVGIEAIFGGGAGTVAGATAAAQPFVMAWSTPTGFSIGFHNPTALVSLSATLAYRVIGL